MPSKLNVIYFTIYFSCFLLFVEPIEVIQTTPEVPWHYIVPSSIFAIVALLVALCINFLRLRKGSKLVVSIHEDFLINHYFDEKSVKRYCNIKSVLQSSWDQMYSE